MLQQGTPCTFAPDRVIRGWTEALQMLKDGDRWELSIPSELGCESWLSISTVANTSFFHLFCMYSTIAFCSAMYRCGERGAGATITAGGTLHGALVFELELIQVIADYAH